MITSLIASLAATVVLSQNSNCEYGQFSSVNDTCMFDCEYNQNYVAISSLSFDFIRSQCSDVNRAYKNGYCDSLADLVYSNSSCNCPYCKCSTESSEILELYTNFPSKECNNCTCGPADSWLQISDNVIECNDIGSVSEPFNWELFSCPPNKCVESDQTYYSGGNWWPQVADGELCEEFCYCPDSGDAVCQSGYANILGTDDMRRQFINTCGWNARACYDMDTQSYDVDRLFTMDTGSSCSYNCPYCSCPDGIEEKEVWYYESQDLNDIANNFVQCNLCNCTKHSDGYLYADCSGYSTYEVGSGQLCEATSTELYQCHEEYSESSDPDTLDPESCEIDDDDIEIPTNYCSWNYQTSDPYYEWECGTQEICEAFASDGCIYANITDTYTNCDGLTITSTYDRYLGCCDASVDGNNCNHESISIDECTHSTAYEQYLVNIDKCDRNADFNCDETVQAITCDGIQALNEAKWECYCSAYSEVYGLLSSETQEALQVVFDKVIPLKTDAAAWNEILDCDLFIKCDLSSGEVSATTTAEPTTAAPTTAAPTNAGSNTDEPTPAPVEIIENECTPACDDGYSCNLNGDCKKDAIIPSDGPCTDSTGCDAGYVCETDAGFCYYSECVDGDCNDGNKCVETTKSQNGTSYQSGICQAIGGGGSTGSAQRFKVFASIITVMIMNFI